MGTPEDAMTEKYFTPPETWEDTVMKDTLIWVGLPGSTSIKDELLKQAKATWEAAFEAGMKAGKLAGMRTVVKWVEARNKLASLALVILRDEWQAQLKLWGIKE